MLASHLTSHGDALTELCPILLILWVVLVLLGLIGLVTRRPLLLDPAGCLVGALVVFIIWAVLC